MDSKLPNISKTEYYLRLGVILLALLTPIFFLLSEGYLPSISSYWRTPVQPLFIITNAATSYYFFASHNTWKIPAIFLLLLTSFSVDSYPMTHNIFAILFFISCLLPLYKTHHHKEFFWIYMSSVIFMPLSMTLGELLAITVLCTHHALILHKIYTIQKK